ncbi:hypothetical protein AGMMS49579_07250 [Spirochaetia bacterium]|nr:hypothetical protein AGMMS49579_07250 [Spirochaetia bacterium]
MNKICGKSIFVLVCLLNTGLSFAEEPIVPFDQKFALSVSAKYNVEMFLHQGADYASYSTDRPLDIGFGFRYKGLAASAYIPVNFKFTSFDVALNLYFQRMYFETAFKRYENFYPGEVTDENAGLDIMSSGILAGWIHNYKNHSLRSVFTLSEGQTVSSGSFLYGFGAFYTSVLSKNDTLPRYKERQHIVYFGPTGGYSYTWILPFDIFLNAGINVGANLGIDINEPRVLFIPQINPRIAFGYHHISWSINMVMGCNASLLLWSKDDIEILVPATVSITFSKRF